jgi:hypothetical protein
MGLYDDDLAAVTSGDVNSKEFFYAKAHAEALEFALKSKQPEGAIKDFLKEVIKAQDEALKTYANHGDLKKWKERAETIQKKISPSASWTSWKHDWPWNSPYVHGWVEYHWAKCAKEAGDWNTVYEQSRAAQNHLGEYGAQKEMKSWSKELQDWLPKAKAEMEALWEESRKHK